MVKCLVANHTCDIKITVCTWHGEQGIKMGSTLRKLREDHGLSRRSLSFFTGVTERTIAHIEDSPEYMARGKTYKTLADYFSCSVDYLMGRTDIPHLARARETTNKNGAKTRI